MKLPEWLKIALYALSTVYAGFCEFFNLDGLVFGFILSAMIWDWLTGTYRAAIGKGERYSSTRGNNGIIVKVLGAGSILLTAVALKLLNVPHHEYFSTIFLSLLAVNDLLSSFSNIYTIRTGETLNEFDAVSLIIRSMHEMLKKVVQKAVGKLKNISE